jgi:asparagine synthase (glutamine-hydrolysing)
MRATAEGVAAALIPSSGDRRSTLARAARFIKGAGRPRADRYRTWLSVYTPEMKAALYANPAIGSRTDRLAEVFAGLRHLDGVDAMLAGDVAWYLPTDLLVKMDIATMAHSLESRSPFLDWRLTEFAAKLPSSLKLRGRTTKYILKKAIADIVPPDNMHRAKQGFAVPIGGWFRGELRDFLADHILGDRFNARGLFKPAEVRRIFDDHQREAHDYAHHLWVLLMLELWFRTYMDQQG